MKPRMRPDGEGGWRDADDDGPGAMPEYTRDALDARASGRRSAPEGQRMTDSYIEAGDVRAPIVTPGMKARGGFHTFGEFLRTATIAARGEASAARQASDRLQNAALTTYGTEGSGADGGYAVPPEFRDTILTKVTGEDSLLSRTEQIPTSRPGVTFPKDEGAPWGTTGIQAYWDGEGATMTQKKPALESSTVKLHKITALVPVTDELLGDAPALATYVANKAGDAIDFKVSDAIINGSGAGQPLGILNAPCLVTQAAESSQVVDTIHGLNLVKMWARMPARWRSSAVWLAHPDSAPAIMTAGLQIGPAAAGTATGGALLYLPSGVSGEPTDYLLGRPIVYTQACQVVGDVGDLVFASLGQYFTFVRSPGLKADSSIHLWFDQGVTAFRFTLRIGGQPAYSAPITDKNGSTTRSPFVALAAR